MFTSNPMPIGEDVANGFHFRWLRIYVLFKNDFDSQV